jgi:5-(carboxyamino)imidazole ribonucleotide synthase
MNKSSIFDTKIGVLGGGQLGRMLLQNALNFNFDVSFLDQEGSPCQACTPNFIIGNIQDYDDVIKFGKDKDVITIEIENVNIEALKELEANGVKVYPQPKIIELIQDKGLQKQFYLDNGIPTADFILFDSESSTDKLVFPRIHKIRKGGYDGKGVQFVNDIKELTSSFKEDSILEECVNFKKELSVIVARNEDGETATFPLVEQEFNSEANLVEFLFSPAEVENSISSRAREIAIEVIEKLDMVGLLAVELFLDQDDNLLVNEVAPRPHNSGHQTIEGNITSQFEQHLRSILNLPLGSTSTILPAVMINLLGEKGHVGPVAYQGLAEAVKNEGVYPHLYGKNTTKPFRKMGHITVINSSLEKAKALALKMKDSVKVESK